MQCYGFVWGLGFGKCVFFLPLPEISLYCYINLNFTSRSDFLHVRQYCFLLLFQVTHISLVLTANDFHPEKYESLGNILRQLYMRSGNAASILDSYLGVVTRGVCNGEENGTFRSSEYDSRQAYASCPLRGTCKITFHSKLTQSIKSLLSYPYITCLM